MRIEDRHGRSTENVFSTFIVLVFAVTTTFTAGWTAQGQNGAEPPSTNQQANSIDRPMPEALRSSVHKVVVIAGQSPANQAVTGSFERETAGLLGGIESGSKMGTISKEIGGVPISIPIPGLAIPGAIFGGLSGATKRRIQDFRDALTEEIVGADSPPLRSDGLALDAFWSIRRLPHIESNLFAPTVEIPEDTDAILYVSLDDLTIDVQGKEAIITASAVATLRRLSDARNVYETVIKYQDKDTLSNWTENDNALWRNYTNFARYYLGREIGADVFNRVELSHKLTPLETDTAVQARKNKIKFISETLTPMLAWELVLDGGDSDAAWTDAIDESDIFYDIEIFDNRRLVYDEKQVSESHHVLGFELEPCQTYRWSVRPVYHVAGEIKFGDWMRLGPDTNPETGKGISGRQASEAPAYTQDFALLEIECRRR